MKFLIAVALWFSPLMVSALDVNHREHALGDTPNVKEKQVLRKRRALSSADAASVSSSLGIPESGISSIATSTSCCETTFPCWLKGGLCLPEYFKYLIPKYDSDACYDDDCICALPKECPCKNEPQCSTETCGGGGKCKDTCASSEVTSSWYKCPSGSDCKCCLQCSGKCSGGYCRKKCYSNEDAKGQCKGSKDCHCCKPKVADNCSGSCGYNGKCMKKFECSISGGMSGGSCGGSISCVCCRFFDYDIRKGHDIP